MRSIHSSSSRHSRHTTDQVDQHHQDDDRHHQQNQNGDHRRFRTGTTISPVSFVATTAAKLLLIAIIATVVTGLSPTTNNDVIKPSKAQQWAKKFHQKSQYYWNKHAVTQPSTLVGHDPLSDAYYYNQRQAMMWGQRWQRPSVVALASPSSRTNYHTNTVYRFPPPSPHLYIKPVYRRAPSPKPVMLAVNRTLVSYAKPRKPVVITALPSIIRETPVAAPSIRTGVSSQAIDWSSPEMLQQPELDETRRVS